MKYTVFQVFMDKGTKVLYLVVCMVERTKRIRGIYTSSLEAEAVCERLNFSHRKVGS